MEVRSNVPSYIVDWTDGLVVLKKSKHVQFAAHDIDLSKQEYLEKNQT